nr:putative esterase afoc [Quercus suber]
MAYTADHPQALDLPRLLCLHGGGTNARIFRAQLRAFYKPLASSFRLVFPDAPYLTTPGTDVTSVYGEWGPFKAWLRPGPLPNPLPDMYDADQTMITDIDTCISTAIHEDNDAGATGPIVGLLGFSQGAKMAASLLLRSEVHRQEGGGKSSDETTSEPRNLHFRFAVLSAGSLPLVNLLGSNSPAEMHSLRLTSPTIHIFGLLDPGIAWHRRMLFDSCEDDCAEVVEWQGGHRMPFKDDDVAAVTDRLLEVARDTATLPGML